MCKDVKYSVKYLGRISIKRYVHATYGVMEMDDQISISRFAFPTERKRGDDKFYKYMSGTLDSQDWNIF